VAARIAGRIDNLYLNETGQMVEAGDVLASLYSPDLVVTVNNLTDASQALGAGEWDLVVTDMHLSNRILQGPLEGERVVRIASGKGIPCIAVSSHASPRSAHVVAEMLAQHMKHVLFIAKSDFARDGGKAIHSLLS